MKYKDFNKRGGSVISWLVSQVSKLLASGGGSSDSIITVITLTSEQEATLLQEGVVEFPHEKVTTPLLRIVATTNSTTLSETHSGGYVSIDTTGPTGKVDTIIRQFALFEDGSIIFGYEELDII